MGFIGDTILGLGITALMPGVLKVGGFAARNVVSPIMKMATSSSIGRAAVGAGVGGITGYLNNDYQSSSNIFESVIKGATLGAIGGGLGISAGKRMISSVPSLMEKTGRAALSVGKFALDRPVMTAGVVGITLAASSIGTVGMGSPTMAGAQINQQYDQQSAAMMELTGGMGTVGGGQVGTAPQIMSQYHRAHQASTVGLVGGLHRGRHG